MTSRRRGALAAAFAALLALAAASGEAAAAGSARGAGGADARLDGRARGVPLPRPGVARRVHAASSSDSDASANARSARRFGGGISGYADVARTRGAPREADAPPIGTGLGATPRAAARPVPIVLPSASDPTKLTLQPEGLDVLRGVRGAVAPVVVIGPYRSGKSFLLNQLLGVACGAGFGVGHTRRTETKGVWVWSEPVASAAAPGTAVVYVDTEGFEATGMSDAYDDRIFALSSIMASVLVYNLPETVKEGDIEKLSFALELAKEFSGKTDPDRSPPSPSAADPRVNDDHPGDADSNISDEISDSEISDADSSQLAAFLPSSLVWLIQRDFLEGSTVNEMVRAALREVPNPGGERHVAELNRVRASLRALAKNHTAFGLKQPHLQRTKLCELADDQLEPLYVEQRATLRAFVAAEARAKIAPRAILARGESGGGADDARAADGSAAAMTGPALAALVERSVNALNEGDFPSAGNVVDSFNRDAMERRLAAYKAAMDATPLPAEASAVDDAHRRASRLALDAFRRERFGRGAITVASLRATLEELRATRSERNAFASARACESSASACEDALVEAQAMRLPSVRKFDVSAERCAAGFEAKCVGPSRATYAARLKRSAERERSAFLQSYNARLLNGMLALAVGGVVFFRFLWHAPLAELFSWALFLVLEVGPKMYVVPGGGSMFDTVSWHYAAKVWEAVVYNPVVDMDVAAPILLGLAAAAVVWVRVRRCVSWVHGCCPCLVPRCCHPLLGVKNEERRRRGGRKNERGRDLDV